MKPGAIWRGLRAISMVAPRSRSVTSSWRSDIIRASAAGWCENGNLQPVFQLLAVTRGLVDPGQEEQVGGCCRYAHRQHHERPPNTAPIAGESALGDPGRVNCPRAD